MPFIRLLHTTNILLYKRYLLYYLWIRPCEVSKQWLNIILRLVVICVTCYTHNETAVIYIYNLCKYGLKAFIQPAVTGPKKHPYLLNITWYIASPIHIHTYIVYDNIVFCVVLVVFVFIQNVSCNKDELNNHHWMNETHFVDVHPITYRLCMETNMCMNIVIQFIYKWYNIIGYTQTQCCVQFNMLKF